MTANPYNFVSIDETHIERGNNWLTNEKFSEHCGKLTCNIVFLSDFITASGNDQNNNKTQFKIRLNDRDPAIQSSTLKGLIRAVAEAMSNSCLSVMNDASIVDREARIDTCDKDHGLCIACRLFGTTVKPCDNEDDFNHGGKIRIYDATYIGQCTENGQVKFDRNWRVTKHLAEHSLNGPKIQHRSFYFDVDKIKGRKFYYHQQNVNGRLMDVPHGNATRIELVKRNSAFQFEIAFENLTNEEYGLLLWALELKEGLGHKIGMAKPLGLGSCVVCVTEIQKFDKHHYLNIDDKVTNLYGDDLKNEKCSVKKFWKKPIPPDLECILTIDNGFDVAYPANGSVHFKGILHPPCEDFAGKKINKPTSNATGDSCCHGASQNNKGHNPTEIKKKGG